jgi:hypothetical protein
LLKAVIRPGPEQSSNPEKHWALVIAPALLGWRFIADPLAELWRDWMVVFALWWYFTAVNPRLRGRADLVWLTMAYILAIYLAGQAPRALEVLGTLP